MQKPPSPMEIINPQGKSHEGWYVRRKAGESPRARRRRKAHYVPPFGHYAICGRLMLRRGGQLRVVLSSSRSIGNRGCIECLRGFE